MDKKNKIIIIVGIAVIILATVLIITLVDSMTEGKGQENTGPYTLRPTTTQAQPSVTDSWVLDINQIAGDASSSTDVSSTSSFNVITTMPNGGYAPGLYYDQYGNIVDHNGNVIVPHSNNQGGVDGGGNNSGTAEPSIDSTDALDEPNTENSEMSEYEIDEQGVLLKYLGDKKSIVIPEEVQGIKVTGIGARCFEGLNIKSVQIPSCVTFIGSYAFKGCKQLSAIFFVDSNVSVEIGSFAFDNCDSLEQISLPKVNLSNSAFNNCDSLKTVVLAEGSKKIGSYVFSDCTSLQYVKIPMSVSSENIGVGVFMGCPEDVYVVADPSSDAYIKFKDAGIRVETHE